MRPPSTPARGDPALVSRQAGRADLRHVRHHSVRDGLRPAVLLGFFGMATNPVLIGMAVRYADRAPTLASALSTAVGSWIAGFAIASTLGPTGPVLVGTCVAALYFLPLGILFTMERRSARGRTRDREAEG